MAWPSGKAEACKASIPSSNLGATLLFFIQVILLYLVATPIGNLSDITYRAIEVLKASHYILCEDTRHASQLLNHYHIQKPLKSYHKFNEAAREDSIIEDLKAGQDIALISDAGTPGISDPGMRIVAKCWEEGVKVISIPGPCAAITALTCSGLSTERFQFVGFLPRKQEELKKELREILLYAGTTVCYESANRLRDVLEEIDLLAPNRTVVVARELTKKFEEVKQGTAREIVQYFAENILKGEIILLIAGETTPDWSQMTPEEHVELLVQEYRITRQEAIKMAAKLRGVSKRDIYNRMMRDE